MQINISVGGNIRVLSDTGVLTPSDGWQDGWATDTPERPWSTSAAGGYRGNSGEPPANVSRAARTV